MRIALSGSNFILGGSTQWGTQIVVIDNGNEREVILTAVGDDLADQNSKGSFSEIYYELKDSKKRVNAIARMIME